MWVKNITASYIARESRAFTSHFVQISGVFFSDCPYSSQNSAINIMLLFYFQLTPPITSLDVVIDKAIHKNASFE